MTAVADFMVLQRVRFAAYVAWCSAIGAKVAMPVTLPCLPLAEGSGGHLHANLGHLGLGGHVAGVGLPAAEVGLGNIRSLR